MTDGGTRPAWGNVYQGTWTKTGPHEYTFTFMGLMYDETGALAGYFKTHETVTVEPGGSVYNGMTQGQVFDADMVLIVEFSGTTHATRIPAD